jgi:hypothetical protein
MALIPIDQVGQIGIVKDINAWQLPNNVWTDGNNIRAEHGAIQKTPGYKEVMASCPIAPYYITNLVAGTTSFWIVGGLTKIYVHNGSTWTNITRQTSSSDVNYSATAKENWTSTVLGGVLVMSNGYDVPQFWGLTSGLPGVSTKMADLSNWSASTHYPFSVKAFRSFLIALNVTKAGTAYTSLVKWSHEAATQALPSSWDETSATLDAGEYELADSKGDIVDGLPLADKFMIYKQDSTYVMSYVGTPFIFAFRQLSPTIGAFSKNCVVEFNDKHFILGNGDIYVNDGMKLQSILPHKMRDYLFSSMNGDESDKSFVTADYGATEMYACYVSSSNVTNVQCDKALVWNWVNNTFTERDLPNLGMMAFGQEGDPLASASWSADTTTWANNTKNWSTSGASSFFNTAGKSLVMASATDTKLYRHNTGNTEDGTNMTSYIERTGLTMDEQGQPNPSMVKHVTSVWPKMSSSDDDDVNVYVGHQMSTEESITWEGPYTFNPDTQSKVPVRVSGKYIGVKFESTGDQTWRLDGYSLDIKNAGNRGSTMN